MSNSQSAQERIAVLRETAKEIIGPGFRNEPEPDLSGPARLIPAGGSHRLSEAERRARRVRNRVKRQRRLKRRICKHGRQHG